MAQPLHGLPSVRCAAAWALDGEGSAIEELLRLGGWEDDLIHEAFSLALGKTISFLLSTCFYLLYLPIFSKEIEIKNKWQKSWVFCENIGGNMVEKIEDFVILHLLISHYRRFVTFELTPSGDVSLSPIHRHVP